MLEEEELVEEGGLRIRARSGAGCSAPLQFGLFLEALPEEDDIVLSGKGIRIFMDPMSAWSLDGLFIDWVDDPEHGEGFAFRHPRGAGGRSC
jgi:Fe-S cluster assembly iron-binding protein IscA